MEGACSLICAVMKFLTSLPSIVAVFLFVSFFLSPFNILVFVFNNNLKVCVQESRSRYTAEVLRIRLLRVLEVAHAIEVRVLTTDLMQLRN